MKTSITFMVLLLLFASSGYCAEKNTEVSKYSNGWYSSKISDDLGGDYFVDTKTQLCFIGWLGYTIIPCSSLKKRPEWKDIITWE
ncbi:MAG: hypothetical protein HOP34_02515 [Methylococcaceae bacterium]|nr:hypothetical protein [Methylococcaceae bacterium]